MHPPEEIVAKLLGRPYDALDERTQKVARHIAERKHIARNLATDPGQTTNVVGQHLERAAEMGGALATMLDESATAKKP